VEGAPVVSIVVPTLNSERTVEDLLNSLSSQTYKSFEVVVVDGGSVDKTVEIALHLGARVIIEPVKGVGAARKKGVLEAGGELIAFIDSDCRAPNDWLEKLVTSISQREEVAAVGGFAVPAIDNLVSKCLEYRLYGFEKRGNIREVDSVATLNAIYRKQAILSVGNFDSRLEMGEDPDLNYRLRRKGLKILFSPSIFVYHNHPATLLEVVTQWFKYGRSFAKINLRESHRFVRNLLPRLIYFLFLVLSVLMTVISPRFWLLPLVLFASPSVIYLRAAFFGFRETGNVKLLLALPIIHLLKLQAHLLGIILSIAWKTRP
jgi:glycosyltransferase involved in cell wall biosynthesis